MARNVTTSEMVARARSLSKVKAITVSNADCVAMLNSYQAELWDILYEENSDWNLDSQLIDLVSGEAEYSFDADFYKLRAVDVLDAQGNYEDMEEFDFGRRNDFEFTTGTRENIVYTLIGSTLRIYPTPAYSLTSGVRLWFCPAYTVLAWDPADDDPDTVVNYHNDWSQYLVLRLSLDLKVIVGDDPSATAILLRQTEKRVRRAMKRRSKTGPRRLLLPGRKTSKRRAWGQMPQP